MRTIKGTATIGGGRGEAGINSSFNPNPDPPLRDVLGKPLVLTTMPFQHLPEPSWRIKLSRFLTWHGLGPALEIRRQRWQAIDTAAMAMAIFSGRRTPPPLFIHHNSSVLAPSFNGFRHPYQMRPAFSLLVRLPEAIAAERKLLEVVLAMGLRDYVRAFKGISETLFNLGGEAREYFQEAIRTERLMRMSRIDDERNDMVQIAYDCYFHGIQYYLYALIARENLPAGNRLFSSMYRGSLFMARIDRGGRLLDKPIRALLPTRNQIMFYATHDAVVTERFRSDPGFAQQFRNLRDSLPR
ncbi:conserved hypothetical protein [uncultured Gammaproteobacteria bacterium]